MLWDRLDDCHSLILPPAFLLNLYSLSLIPASFATRSRPGYTRVILAALSLYFMRGNPKVCTVLYGISCLLDAFDGMAARALGQVSGG